MTVTGPGEVPSAVPGAPAGDEQLDASPQVGSAAKDGSMFAPLRVPAYLRLWLGSGVVAFGVMGQGIARSWLAFELTGSNAALGGVLLAFGVAMLLTTPFGGVVGDRAPKRLIIQCCVALLAATSFWMGLVVALDVVTYWQLLVVSVLQAGAFAFYIPARAAFTAELVPPDELPEAIGLMLVQSEATRVAGPAIAGVLIGALAYGLEVVFFSCMALFLGGLVAGIRLPHGRRNSSVPLRAPLGELRDGISYVAKRSDLRALMLCTFGVVMLGFPYVAFLPAVAEDLFDVGSAGYGLISATSAAGAVAAGLLIGRLRRWLGAWRLVVVAGAVSGVGLLCLAAAPTFPIAVLAVLPIGAGMLVFQTGTQALLLALSDVTLHGRVQSLVMLSFGIFGVVALPLGVLADAIGLRPTFTGMGVSVLLVLALFLLVSRKHWSSTRLLDLG